MFKIKARLILLNLDKILLLLQTNKQGGKYTLVGGHVEEYEYASKALIRECYEEVGIQLFEKDLELVHVLHKKNKRDNTLTLYFTTEVWQGSIENKEPKKFSQVGWFPIHQLPARTSPTSRHVINQYLDGQSYSDFRRT